MAISGTDALHLPVALLMVFGSAKLLAEVCERIGQPGIVGEILAGILIGPSVLRWVYPDQTLSALAELGVMFLLFRVGLEVKASDLMKVGRTAFVVATLGVAVPLGAGVLVMAWAGVSHIEALFVGASLVATSVGITAQVLAAKGLLQERASRVILAAAVIDDVLGLLVLAFVSSLAEGRVNYLKLASTAVLATGFTVLIAKFGTRTMQRIIPRVEQRLKVSERQFNLSLILLFVLSVLALKVGVAAIVGAFLAGMALSETVGHRAHDMAQGVSELLVPFFLAGVGLHIDLSAFEHRETVVLSAVVILVAILSKFIGCGIGAWNLGARDRFRIGVGMIPRGEVGMVVAQLGLGLGVIEKPIYAVVVLMTVVTTMVAPPLLKIAYRGTRPGVPKEEFELG
jgi:Kef-type K+ transport system membrane component KefB